MYHHAIDARNIYSAPYNTVRGGKGDELSCTEQRQVGVRLVRGGEVALVKVMETHNTIFTSRREHLSIGRNRHGVDGTEVALE